MQMKHREIFDLAKQNFSPHSSAKQEKSCETRAEKSIL